MQSTSSIYIGYATICAYFALTDKKLVINGYYGK